MMMKKDKKKDTLAARSRAKAVESSMKSAPTRRAMASDKPPSPSPSPPPPAMASMPRRGAPSAMSTPPEMSAPAGMAPPMGMKKGGAVKMKGGGMASKMKGGGMAPKKGGMMVMIALGKKGKGK